MSNQQISNERFSFYADYYAYIAAAGLESSKPLVRATRTAMSVNSATFEVVTDAIQVRNYLVNNLESSYDQIFTEAYSLSSMQRSFFDLSEHVRQWTGKSVDDYLSENGIKVFRAYGSIMTALGEPISEDNIV